jgi:hypothetical protein
VESEAGEMPKVKRMGRVEVVEEVVGAEVEVRAEKKAFEVREGGKNVETGAGEDVAAKVEVLEVDELPEDRTDFRMGEGEVRRGVFWIAECALIDREGDESSWEEGKVLDEVERDRRNFEKEVLETFAESGEEVVHARPKGCVGSQVDRSECKLLKV